MLVASYKYRMRDGGEMAEKKRYLEEDGKKSFLWWRYGRIGKQGDPLLYHPWGGELPQKVYLVEGEKDADNLVFSGLVALSIPNGAQSKWEPWYTEELSGHDVVILPDNDAPGRSMAAKVAHELHGRATSVKVLDLTQEWPDLPEKGDVSDVLDILHTPMPELVERLAALEAITAEWEPGKEEETDPFLSLFRTLNDFEEGEAEWIVPGWIVKGQVALLAADGGVGKTSLWCNIIAALSSGKRCILDGPEVERNPMRVMFMTTEDSVRTVLKKKLRLAGANMENILIPDFLADKSHELDGLKFGEPNMARAIRYFKPALIVFDPVQGFVPADINMGSRNAMRDCLAPLVSIGEETGTASLLIAHSNKRKGAAGRDRIADSADLWDIARTVMMAGRTEKDGVRYLSNEKNNYAPQQETILFSIENEGLVVKQGTTWKKDREYMMEAQVATAEPAREDCKAALLQLLDEAGGTMGVNELEEELKGRGFSGRTIRLVKSELKMSSAILLKQDGSNRNKKWFATKTEFSEPETYMPPDDALLSPDE